MNIQSTLCHLDVIPDILFLCRTQKKVFVWTSAGQRLIVINHIQNKSYVHNIYVCVLCMFIMYCTYKYTHVYYIFKKNSICFYIKYIYLYYKYLFK